jgi:hypothetical protein
MRSLRNERNSLLKCRELHLFQTPWVQNDNPEQGKSRTWRLFPETYCVPVLALRELLTAASFAEAHFFTLNFACIACNQPCF